MPAVRATPFPSSVTPEMFTVTGSVLLPTAATITPRPSRRSGSSAAMRLSSTRRGSIVTRSAPAPRSVRSLLMISTEVPGVPGPSAYVPGQIEIVSPGAASRIASRILRYPGLGQLSLCLPTTSVDGALLTSPCAPPATTASAAAVAMTTSTSFPAIMRSPRRATPQGASTPPVSASQPVRVRILWAGLERCPSGLRSATGNRVWAERSIAGSNPALSAKASLATPPKEAASALPARPLEGPGDRALSYFRDAGGPPRRRDHESGQALLPGAGADEGRPGRLLRGRLSVRAAAPPPPSLPHEAVSERRRGRLLPPEARAAAPGLR